MKLKSLLKRPLVTAFCFSFLFAAPLQARALLSFDNALKLAYQNNPELQAQIQQAEMARGQCIQDGLWLNPSVMLEIENFGGSGAYTSYEAAETTLSVTQPVPLGGKRSWLQRASFVRFQAMRASVLRKKAEIYMAVGEAYVNVYYASHWHQITKKLVGLNQDIVKDIKRRKKAGASAELDLRLAEVALGEAKIQESRARRLIQKQYAMLEQWVGQEALEIYTRVDKGPPHRDVGWDKVKKAMDCSVFIHEKTAEIAARRVAITAVKKDVWPTVDLRFGGRHFSDDNQNAMVASVNSVMPVFDRNQGKILTAEAALTQSLEDLRATKLRLRQQLRSAWLELQQNIQESRMVKNELLPNAEKASRLAIQGYQKGLYSYVQLSIAMRTLFAEERHYQEAHARRDTAMIKLSGLLSKGAS